MPRFFYPNEIVCGADIAITSEQMFHAAKVLRLKESDHVKIFNGDFGEWNCEIKNVKKNLITPTELIREPREEIGTNVACAIINPNKFAIMIEKITELGVQNIYPIITDYTQYNTFNRKKIEQVIIQACEQSERLTVPCLHEPKKLKIFVENLSGQQKLLVGLERASTTQNICNMEKNSIFLVGPEGGFSDGEIDLFKSYKSISCFHFGHNILRSETAAIAFVSAWVSKFA